MIKTLVFLLLHLSTAWASPATYQAGMFEGDIAVRPSSSSSAQAAFITDSTKIWSGGKVPYEIDRTISDQAERDLIKEALDDIQAVTCITFQDISQAQGTKPYSFIK